MLNQTSNNYMFNRTFEKINHIEKLELSNNNCLEIYSLPIVNNSFDYLNLKNLITDNIKSYVFSRKKVKEAEDIGRGDALFNEARKKFRTLKNEKDDGAGGELGEVLLYIFLETELKAYKLLSKMELKTSSNDYIKGADGVFLYQYDLNEHKVFDLILGESKIENNLSKAITEAFKSIVKHLINNDFEVDLVNENIFKETFDEEEIEQIKNMIIPYPEDFDNNICKARSFGIFIGYSLDVDIQGKNMVEGQKIIKARIEEDIKDISKKLNKKIKENRFATEFILCVYITI